MLRSLVRFLTGWAAPPSIHHFDEDAVVIFTHTSYFEILVLWLYSEHYFQNIVTRVRPNLVPKWISTEWREAILNTLQWIEAPAREDRGRGGVEKIVEKVRSLWALQRNERYLRPQYQRLFFLMNPKGTVMKAEWRTGYMRIAQQLGVPVYCINVNYEKRCIEISNKAKADEASFQHFRPFLEAAGPPFRPERCEYELKKPYDPFELLSCVDLVSVTMAACLPAVWYAFWYGPFILFLTSFINVIISWVYHSHHECIWKELDANVSKINILTGLFMARRWTLPFVFWASFAAMCYYAGTPRHALEPRGRYVVYHSAFHVAIGIASWYLVTA